jgi:predicted DNA-binding transcriptional regulator AlpA
MTERIGASRVRVEAVMEMTGLPRRQVQRLAAAGEIPEAALIGRLWTFDPEAVRLWIASKVRKATCRKPTTHGSTSAALSGGSHTEDYGALYRQAIYGSPERHATGKLRRSTANA